MTNRRGRRRRQKRHKRRRWLRKHWSPVSKWAVAGTVGMTFNGIKIIFSEDSRLLDVLPVEPTP